MSEDPEFKGGNTKYYIIATAVIVFVLGAMFFWYVDGGGFGFTGASTASIDDQLTGAAADDSTVGTTTHSGKVGASGSNSNSDSTTSTNSRSYSDDSSMPKNPTVSIKASMDSVPSIKSPTRIEDLEIRFSNLNTNIKVNKEQLELTALDKVVIKLHGFAGNINLNERTLSLDGRITKIDVNGVVLSSEELEITFDGLDYDYVSTQGMELAGIDLSNGEGKLDLEQGKVIYTVENKDRISLSSFFGDVTVDESIASPLLIEGTAKGVTTVGAVNLILQ